MANLPSGWAQPPTPPSTAARDYINWSWKNVPYETVTGETRAKFDFRVFPFISGQNSAEVDEDHRWNISFEYQVVDISGPGRGFNVASPPSQQQLIRELLSLSYATVNPLPKKDDKIFDGYGNINTGIGGSVFDGPVIDQISVKQHGTSSEIWLITFKSKKVKYYGFTVKNPTEDGSQSTSFNDPMPWEKKPRVDVSFGTEQFNIGCGYFMGSASPQEVANNITNFGGVAGMFVPSNQTFDVVKNSVGDPIKSPQSLKLSIANYNFEVAYKAETKLSTLISFAQSAMSKVNGSSFTFPIVSDVYSIPIGAAMLTSFSIRPAEIQDKRDWLPKQKHPFERTYKQIGWTVSSLIENRVAVNQYAKTLTVNQSVEYKVLQFTISVKSSGWGMIIPNRGYRSFDKGPIPTAITNENSTVSEERLMDGAGLVLPSGVSTYDKQCMRVYTPFAASSSLSSLVSGLPWDREYPVAT